MNNRVPAECRDDENAGEGVNPVTILRHTHSKNEMRAKKETILIFVTEMYENYLRNYVSFEASIKLLFVDVLEATANEFDAAR